MQDTSKFVSIIPIRSGSKGFPNKNIIPLKGIPLYKHSLFQSQRIIPKTLISTDIEMVLKERNQENIIVLRRPKQLCGDSIQMKEVLIDIFQKHEKDLSESIIILLQVTSPLRQDKDIKNAIKMYQTGKYSMIMSVTETDSSILKCGFVDDSKFINLKNENYTFSNRQELPKIYKPNGAIYIFSTKDFMKEKNFPHNSIGAYFMPSEYSIDIDTKQDLNLIEEMLSSNKIEYQN
tara:strand:+ start:7279 stop:7980 length:702 start_codon:yes stop_codon:yes gene_type:complete